DLVPAASAQLLAAQPFDLHANRRHGAVWHGPRLLIAHESRRGRVPPHMASAAPGDVPRMDAARRAARAAEAGRWNGTDASGWLRQLDLQAESALHPRRPLRLRRETGFGRSNRETIGSLTHPVAERVGVPPRSIPVAADRERS